LNADHQRVLGILGQCCDAIAANPSLKAVEKRRVQDTRKRMSTLESVMRAGSITPSCNSELMALCNAMQAKNYAQAKQHQVNMVKNDWNGNNGWLPGIKTLVLLAEKFVM